MSNDLSFERAASAAAQRTRRVQRQTFWACLVLGGALALGAVLSLPTDLSRALCGAGVVVFAFGGYGMFALLRVGERAGKGPFRLPPSAGRANGIQLFAVFAGLVLCLPVLMIPSGRPWQVACAGALCVCLAALLFGLAVH